MNVEQLITAILAIAPILAVVVTLWAASQSNSHLNSAGKIGEVVLQMDAAHDPDIRAALIEAQEDLLISYLRRHRWNFGAPGRVLLPAVWSLVGITSAALLQATGWSDSFGILWILAPAGILLGLFGFARIKWIRFWYKDEGKLYLGHANN